MYWNIVFFEWAQRRLLLFYLKDVKVIRCGALSIKCNRIVKYFGKNLNSTCKHECMLHQWITVLFFPWNCGLWISSSCQLPCNISWIVLTSSCAGGLTVIWGSSTTMTCVTPCLVPRPHYWAMEKARLRCVSGHVVPAVRLGYVAEMHWQRRPGKTPYTEARQCNTLLIS